MPDMVQLIKRAALEAIEASKPTQFLFGRVMNLDPLQIQVDQKVILGQKMLLLTSRVVERQIELTLDHQTESALGQHSHSYSGQTQGAGEGPHSHSYSGQTQGLDLAHVHRYQGRKTVTLHSGLKTGDLVLLARMQGGKQYIVLDRLEAV